MKNSLGFEVRGLSRDKKNEVKMLLNGTKEQNRTKEQNVTKVKNCPKWPNWANKVTLLLPIPNLPLVQTTVLTPGPIVLPCGSGLSSHSSIGHANAMLLDSWSFTHSTNQPSADPKWSSAVREPLVARLTLEKLVSNYWVVQSTALIPQHMIPAGW